MSMSILKAYYLQKGHFCYKLPVLFLSSELLSVWSMLLLVFKQGISRKEKLLKIFL